MELDNLFNSPCKWLEPQGEFNDVIISTRIRLARNIKGFPFSHKASKQQKNEIEDFIHSRLKQSNEIKRMLYVNLNEITSVDKLFLVERHLISREHANSEGARSVTVSKEESISIMVNEEDHIRMQILSPGLNLEGAWEQINVLDDQLEQLLPYIFSSELGYLTCCPTNTGTGMRSSVMLHLPALVLTRVTDKVFQAMKKLGYNIRGLYGEGTQAQGDFYQISSLITLGKSETQTLREIKEVVIEIARFEKTWREKLLNETRLKVEDKVYRAIGVLENARAISSEETLEQLSMVRLGVYLGFVSNTNIHEINSAFLNTQPGHLQKREGQILDPLERDTIRANYIRKFLFNN